MPNVVIQAMFSASYSKAVPIGLSYSRVAVRPLTQRLHRVTVNAIVNLKKKAGKDWKTLCDKCRLHTHHGNE